MRLTVDKVREIIQKINGEQKVDNETLFWVLRFCEKRYKKNTEAHWKRRIDLLKNQIVTQNTRLYQKYAYAWHPGIDEDAINSEFNLSITRAIKYFDPKKGVRWSTYVSCVLKKTVWRVAKISSRHLSWLPLDDNIIDSLRDKKEEAHPYLCFIKDAWDDAGLNERERNILSILVI